MISSGKNELGNSNARREEKSVDLLHSLSESKQ